MASISIVFALCAFAAGLLAAFYWWKASTVETDPGWAGDHKSIEPVEVQLAQAGWIAAILKSAAESAALNRKASLWTAVAVALSTLSGILGLFINVGH